MDLVFTKFYICNSNNVHRWCRNLLINFVCGLYIQKCVYVYKGLLNVTYSLLLNVVVIFVFVVHIFSSQLSSCHGVCVCDTNSTYVLSVNR